MKIVNHVGFRVGCVGYQIVSVVPSFCTGNNVVIGRYLPDGLNEFKLHRPPPTF